MTGTYQTMRPDWLMLGAPGPDGTFVVYASRKLASADLRIEYEQRRPRSVWDPTWPFGTEPERPVVVVQAKGSDYAVATGATYGEAMARILEHWAPPAPPPPPEEIPQTT